MSGGWSGGVFSISADMSANELAGIPILSRPFSDQRDEIIAGINNCLTKDGQNSPTADLPMGSRKHTNVARAVAVTNYLRANEYIHDTPRYMVDAESGATASISCSVEYWPVSASAGMTARIKMGLTKPQSAAREVEVVINGVTMSATDPYGNPLAPGALVSGATYDFVYDGSKFRCINPSVAVRTYTVVLKAFTNIGAPVTISTGATTTFHVAVDDRVVHLWHANNGLQDITFQQSTAVELRWSAMPAHISTATEVYGPPVRVLTSLSTSRTFDLRVEDNSLQIRDQLATTTLGSACKLAPFQITYFLDTLASS